MKKIYFGKNKHGIWLSSFSYETLTRLKQCSECEIDETRIHNDKVYMIIGYHGYDYSENCMYDIVTNSTLFPTVRDAKASEYWKFYEKQAKKHPRKFHTDNISIASDDGGKPFEYGDIMDGKFKIKLIGVRVIGGDK